MIPSRIVLAAVVAVLLSQLLPGFASPARGASAASADSRLAEAVASLRGPALAELALVLAIPNVAADRANILKNAEFLRQRFERRGFAVELLPTEGNPLVFAERRTPGARRTVLIYCHFDGQPVDPKRWAQSDPWQPLLRAGRLEDGAATVPDLGAGQKLGDDWRLYARSASDDKGPIVALLAALDALAAAGVAPGANLKVILDSEEEAGSPSLVPAIARYKDKLAADWMLIFDGPEHPSNQPTLFFGARGIVSVQLTVFGPKVGVHSGNYGGWVPNPALRLAHLLASMKDDEGQVLVKGFYDGIVAPSAEEERLILAVPDPEAALKAEFGIAETEQPGLLLQQAFLKPTLNIRGLAAAHVGDGARTIIPDRAIAELDLRLVESTPPAELLAKLRAHIELQGFHVVDRDPDDATRARHSKIVKFIPADGIPAYRTSTLLPESQAAIAALTRAWGKPPVVLRTLGGTIPIAHFVAALDIPAIALPIVNYDNHQHEENENLRLGHFFRGIRSIAAVLEME